MMRYLLQGFLVDYGLRNYVILISFFLFNGMEEIVDL